jgi:hypothetical protein
MKFTLDLARLRPATPAAPASPAHSWVNGLIQEIERGELWVDELPPSSTTQH